MTTTFWLHTGVDVSEGLSSSSVSCLFQKFKNCQKTQETRRGDELRAWEQGPGQAGRYVWTPGLASPNPPSASLTGGPPPTPVPLAVNLRQSKLAV